MKNKKFAGFTLIELLVAIVIIGVLATISISTFSSYIEKARLAKARSSYAQIKNLFLAQNASTESNLFSVWFPFDNQNQVNTTSPYILDVTDDENHLEITTNSGTYSQDNDTPLGFGNSLKLTGRRRFYHQNWRLANSPTNKITLAFWFKLDRFPPSSTAPYYLLLSTGFVLRNNGSISYYINRGQNSSYIESKPGLVKTGKWYYVIGTYNRISETMKLYVDGELISTKKGVTQIHPFTDRRLGIGNSDFNGNLDEVMMLPYYFNGKSLE